jgi:oligopeptide transport system substrate-binding protein
MIRVFAVLLLSLCVGARAETVLNRGNGAEPQSLDPQFIGGSGEANIVGDLMLGLTTPGPDGAPVPGMADHWTVSADGKTWTFHLRKAVWSDGVPVTAGDFVFAFRRLLDPKTAAPYAFNLWVLKNARAISNGKLAPDALGARVPDDTTLVLTLEHPAPYLPQLLMNASADPLPRHVVAAKGAGWTRAYVSDGPYVLREWMPNDHVTLVKNPKFYDAAHVAIDKVTYYPTLDGEAGLKWLRAGRLDTQTPLPAMEIGWLRANMKAALHIHPFFGISYIAFNLGYGPLKDVRVRRAINLAYDREAVANNILRLGERPAYGYVPPGTANYPGGAMMDFAHEPYPARLAQAQSLMRAAGYGPGKRLHLTLESSFDPNRKRIAAALQAMVKPIFIDLELVQTDLPVHFHNLAQHQFQMGTAQWSADFDDAVNFLDLLRGGNGKNYARYANPRFDAALDAAETEPDAARRGQDLLAAEKITIADYPWLVTGFDSTHDLVEPYVKGWIDNVYDINRTRWLRIDDRMREAMRANR